MPEGDTVHRTARRLDRALSGQVLRISDFRVPSLATRDLAGAHVLETIARGKHLLTRLAHDQSALTLHSHLRMEGAWLTHPVGSRWPRPAHEARVVLATASTEAVGFSVLLDLVPTAQEGELVGHLGPDLLGPGWDAAEAVRRLSANPEVPVADALIDQRNLAGIGNVYRCELCFLFGLDPRTPVGQVPDLARLVGRARQLLEANRDRGNRITTGDRRRPLWVYGRRTCLRCSGPVSTADQGPAGRERLTHWCPRCQPPAE